MCIMVSTRSDIHTHLYLWCTLLMCVSEYSLQVWASLPSGLNHRPTGVWYRMFRWHNRLQSEPKCVLIREVPLIQRCPLRGVPLYLHAHYTTRRECTVNLQVVYTYTCTVCVIRTQQDACIAQIYDLRPRSRIVHCAIHRVYTTVMSSLWYIHVRTC